MRPNKHLTADERAALTEILHKTLSRGRETDRRDAVLLLTALETGLRAQELLNLKFSDLDHESQTIQVKTLKKGMPRCIPAPRCLFEYASSRVCEPAASRAVADQPRPKELIFSIGYQRLVQIWHLYRPCRKKFHALRHTFALSLYRRRKDINMVKHCLGHKSLSSTTCYLEESYETSTLRKAMGLK